MHNPALEGGVALAFFMRAFAQFVMRGRLTAALSASGIALLSLLVPPLSVISNAVVALVGLRQGFRQGAVTTTIAVVVTGLAAMLMYRHAAPALSFLLAGWAPVLLMAVVLRKTVSMGLALEAGAALSLAAVLAMYVVTGDPTTFWEPLLVQTIGPLMLDLGLVSGQAELESILHHSAQLMTGVFAAAIWLSVTLSLILARHWQAQLYNPGGFGQEFRKLRLSRTSAATLLAITVGVVVLPGVTGQFAMELIPTLLSLFGLSGISLIHGLSHGRKQGKYWLGLMYIVLAFMPLHGMVLLAGAGFSNVWLDIQSRLGGGKQD